MTETEYRGPTLNTLFFPATPGSMWANTSRMQDIDSVTSMVNHGLRAFNHGGKKVMKIIIIITHEGNGLPPL